MCHRDQASSCHLAVAAIWEEMEGSQALQACYGHVLTGDLHSSGRACVSSGDSSFPPSPDPWGYLARAVLLSWLEELGVPEVLRLLGEGAEACVLGVGERTATAPAFHLELELFEGLFHGRSVCFKPKPHASPLSSGQLFYIRLPKLSSSASAFLSPLRQGRPSSS